MDIQVKTNTLTKYADKENNVKGSLAKLDTRLQKCRSNLQRELESSYSENVDRALGDIHSRMAECIRKIGGMADALDTAAQLYAKTEEEISGAMPQKEVVEEAKSEVVIFGVSLKDIIEKFFKAGFTKAGIIGLLANSAIDLATGKMDWTKIFKLGNNIVDKGCDLFQGAKWKEVLFGIKGKDIAKSVGKNAKPRGFWKKFGDNIDDELNKYVYQAGKNTGKMGKAASVGKVATKWAGAAMDVVDRTVQNIDEFKDKGGYKNPRFYEEVVTESVIEIGKTILIGAAVTAVVGTGGWAVALGVAAVSIGLDMASNAIANNDEGFTENVSDFIIDKRHETYNDMKRKVNKVTTLWSGVGTQYVMA